MSKKNCEDHREAIAAFVLGELDTVTSAEVRQHLESCQDCQSFHDALEKEEQTIVSAFDTVKSNLDSLESDVLRPLRRQSDQSRSKTATALGCAMKGVGRMTPLHKRISAAVACIAAGIAVVVVLTLSNGAATIAWADVQEQIRNIRTLRFKLTMCAKGGAEMVGEMMVMEPGLMRHKMEKPMKGVTIIDLAKGKMITLMPQQSKVMSVDFSAADDATIRGFHDRFMIAHLKKLAEQSETELGEKEINGRTARGYRVEKPDMTMSVWVDAETCALVEMEMTVFRGEMKMAMTDFEFDRKLDEKLFSLEVPQGYTELTPGVTLKMPAYEDVAVLLRVMARMNDGAFPDALPESPSIATYKEHLQGFDRVLGPKEGRKVVMSLGRAIMFLKDHPDTHYAGTGVKLGDAETPIFWYKPNDSETYKVIYGDLSIKDTAGGDLPE